MDRRPMLRSTNNLNNVPESRLNQLAVISEKVAGATDRGGASPALSQSKVFNHRELGLKGYRMRDSGSISTFS